MNRRPTTTALLAALAALCTACGDDEEPAAVVVGLTTDLAVGFDISYINISTSYGHAASRYQTLSYKSGELVLPEQITFPPLQSGDDVEILVDAFHDGLTTPLISRRAQTYALRGRSIMLPFSLNEACVGVTCDIGATCVDGRCVDPFIVPTSLSDADPHWLDTAPDACKQSLSDLPTLTIGKGETEFSDLDPGEEVTIEAGPQGGHHVWTALHVYGIRQMGSTLTVGGSYPSLGYSLPPYQWTVTLRKSSDSECEVYGIRFQVDRGIPVESILGQPFHMVVNLKDQNGAEVKAEQDVVITMK